MQKLIPFVFMAVAMAFVPQFLNKTPRPIETQHDVNVQSSKTSFINTTTGHKAHYATGKRIVSIKADRQGHYVADFKVAGRTVRGLIDTGATYVAMNRSTARSIGLQVSGSDFKHQAETANGVVKAAFKTIDRLELGSVSAENVEVFILDDASLSSTLIGMSFLNKLSSFGVENNQLNLVQ